jgi:glycosyltransferase involved in cell wall biosynthesis
MYSGNLGRVHDYQTLLDAAAELRGDATVTFLFVGQGHGLRRLRAEASRRGLANLAFKSPQPRERLGALLAVGDVHIVTLAPGMGQFVVPSKFYGVLAAGRPVVFIGGADSEIPRILEEQGLGFAVRSGAVEGLTPIVRRLAGDAQLRQRLGANARHAFERRFSRPAALEAWRRVIETAARP